MPRSSGRLRPHTRLRLTVSVGCPGSLGATPRRPATCNWQQGLKRAMGATRLARLAKHQGTPVLGPGQEPSATMKPIVTGKITHGPERAIGGPMASAARFLLLSLLASWAFGVAAEEPVAIRKSELGKRLLLQISYEREHGRQQG